MIKRKEKQEANMFEGRCLYWTDIPLRITKTNPFFQLMFDVVTIVGLMYKFPPMRSGEFFKGKRMISIVDWRT